MEHLSDQELLEGLRNPESKNYYFNLLCRKFQERLYWHIRRIVLSHEDADDLLQETFIQSWQKIHTFEERSQLSTWLIRIATNKCLDFLKKKRRFFFIPLIDVEKNLEEILEADSYFDGDEAEKKFQKALLSLPEKQRIVFQMRYYEDLKFTEIADILSLSEGGVKSNYHLAQKKLKDFLVDD
ncbi:MAG TPA: RNA polymerase subunit sigma [Flavobacteriales bacterium]|jgi:RNA polymerase sigma-70 factor (ECF subfamily)|nr:RNA polymerase sigma factor [Salibacteraceae bacterium]HAS36152.1 RNA polymerase subunit sigma [Flavobacteriales bacterium]